MTKSIKKVLLMLTTVVLTVVLAACGSGGSGGGSSAPKTPTSKEVFEKYSEVAKNIKSAKFIADVRFKRSINYENGWYFYCRTTYNVS